METVWLTVDEWCIYASVMTHMCVRNLTIIGSDNGLAPGQRQAIIWTNARIFLIELLETTFADILCEIHPLSFKKRYLKTWSAKWRPFCLGPNVLNSQKTMLECVILTVLNGKITDIIRVCIFDIKQPNCRWLRRHERLCNVTKIKVYGFMEKNAPFESMIRL